MSPLNSRPQWGQVIGMVSSVVDDERTIPEGTRTGKRLCKYLE